MRVLSFAITDIGLKRKINQDSYLIDDAAQLYVVADGMGGHLGGEVASQHAVKSIQRHCKENKHLNPRERLNHGVLRSSNEIFISSREKPELSGMGTTVLALLIEDKTAYIAQVGDSRAYLLQGSNIWQVTEDHSLLNEEIRAGRISRQDAPNYQFKNVITRSVGYESDVEVDIYRRELQKGDQILMCSDGLSGPVDSKDFLLMIEKYGPEAGLKHLVRLANERGGDDNITAVLCQVI
mgnify:CR=1 FL=1